MTKAEETLIGIKFILDMYSAGVDTAENTLEKVREILKPVVSLTDDQQASINKAKKYYRKGIDLYDCSIDMLIFDDLLDKEWAEATVAFLMWALEQEEE